MSAPTRRGGDGYDEPYAPPWARHKKPARPAYETRPIPPLQPIPLPRVEPAHDSREAQELVPFEGDLAIKELRQQLTLDPYAMPEPLHRAAPKSFRRVFGKWSLAISLAAVIAIAAVVVLQPRPDEEPAPPDMDRRPGGLASQQPANAYASTRPDEPGAARRLVGEDRRGPVNAPLPFGVTLDGTATGAAIVISGLAAGTRLAPAQPDGSGGWHVAAADLDKVQVQPPKDFVGAMDAIVDLRLVDGAIADSLVVRLEWIKAAAATQEIAPASRQPVAAPPPPKRTMSAEEIAILVRRGHDFLTTGDIAAARVVFRRAAEAGDAHAALTLGATFDPTVLRQVGAVGIAADAAEARNWYRKAEELGSAEATRRLAELARAGR
jgi:hypothetical protein